MSPNQPKTPTRTIRVSDDLWSTVQSKARSEGTSASAVIVAALEAYVDGWSEAGGQRVEPDGGAGARPGDA